MPLNDVGKLVKGWLAAEGYQPEELQAPADARWLQRLRMPNGWFHFVLAPKGNDETIEIQSSFRFSDDERMFIASLPDRRRLELLWELRMGLLFIPTEFILQAGEDGQPAGFDFRRQLSYDGLTRTVFMEALREVHKSNLFASWSLRKEDELRQAV